MTGSFDYLLRVAVRDLHEFEALQQTMDMAQLIHQAEYLMHNNRTLLYGPGRHGPGQNLFIYFHDTEENIVEFAADPAAMAAARARSQAWAAEHFGEVERLYPYSEWAKRALIMQAYAYHLDEDYESSRASAQRYIDFYCC